MKSNNDPLQQLLIDFFELEEETPKAELRQGAIAAWDSLAMVQLISELQNSFKVEFGLDEIEALRSYDEIRQALQSKGVRVETDGSAANY